MNNYQIDYYNLLNAEISLLMSQFKKEMKDQEWNHLSEMLDANELGVTFEEVCGLITEEKIVLNDNQKKQIKILAEAMKIEDKFWKDLV